MLDIGLEGIEDPIIRDALYAILEEVRTQPILNFKWKFFSVAFTEAVTNYRFRHNLGYVPKDVLITRFIGPGTGYIDLDLSDRTHADITTTDACTIRFLLGNLDENSTA